MGFTTEGINDTLDVKYHGGAQVDPWYVGLYDGTGTLAASDTLASHAGWTENTDYSGNRVEFEEAAASGGSITNSANTADFSITGTATIKGAFMASVATGTSGILDSTAAFTGGDRSVISGNTLKVTGTVSLT